MNRHEMQERLALYQERERRRHYRLIESYFPDEGPLRRELYHKHLEFFKSGAASEERLALGANRSGKTETIGGYELTCHLTGVYPPWWEGRRFARPIDCWAAGKSGQTVRDIIQNKLMGPKNDIGSGLIPKHLIHDFTPRRGIPDAIDTILIKHSSGALSTLGFKSYDQGRQSFEGTKKDIVWCDEECPLDVYTECLLRTTDTSGKNLGNGIVMLTFTPLLGLSELVMQFLPTGEIQETSRGSKRVIMITWDDCPHLSDEAKSKMLASIPPFQRDARTKGVPQLGSGAIYPVPESEFVIDDIPIPEHWPKAYGLDVGWNRTAVIWGALNRETDVLYLFSEHYQGQAEPSIHAQAIKSRGEWIPGVIDPASRGRSQGDGQQLIQIYQDLGLNLDTAFNGVESGIYEMWQRISTGRLKVFKSCVNFLSEFRIYRRDEKGHIVKQNDHLMDCSRYLIVSGLNRAKTKASLKPKTQIVTVGATGRSWMG